MVFFQYNIFVITVDVNAIAAYFDVFVKFPVNWVKF